MFLAGVVFASVIELVPVGAWKLWEYGAWMPLVPVIGVGLLAILADDRASAAVLTISG